MNKIRNEFLIVFTAINGFLGILAIPVYMLFLCNVVDYITGLAAAKYRADQCDNRPIKSDKAIWGLVKKLMMYLLIIIMWGVDVMIRYTLRGMFPEFPYPDVLAIFTAAWLIFNEIISILENMDDAGTPIPPFLMPLMKKIKETITIEVEDAKESDKHENISEGNRTDQEF